MNQRVTTPATDLGAARADYDAGRYAVARDAALRWWHLAEAPSTLRRGAGVLAVHAAFRLGEYGEARALLPEVLAAEGLSATTQDRFDLLAVAVVVHGELADYAGSLEALRQLHAHRARADSLRNHVRARGTAAVCLALLGDPWAALRLLTEAAEHLRSLPDMAALEATVCTNHASVCLLAARLSREAGDGQDVDVQLAAAQASTARTRELAARRGDPRLAAFTDVHAAEIALLRDDPRSALEPLAVALAEAQRNDLPGHTRRLALLLAQAEIACGQAGAAKVTLDRVEALLHAGHDWTSHLALHEQRHAARLRLGDNAGAGEALESWRALQLRRHARQLQAQSKFLRLRLELEHLYRQPWRTEPGG